MPHQTTGKGLTFSGPSARSPDGSFRPCACITVARLFAPVRRGSRWSGAGESFNSIAPVLVCACSSSAGSPDYGAMIAPWPVSTLAVLASQRLACRAEHGDQGIYMDARRGGAWTVSSLRPPSARQVPKLNKGSPLPRQRPAFCSGAATSPCSGRPTTTRPNDDDDQRRRQRLPGRSRARDAQSTRLAQRRRPRHRRRTQPH